MKRITTVVALALLISSTIFMIGCQGNSDESDTDSKPKPVSYETPEDAFEAIRVAANDKDWPTFCNAMTDDSVTEFSAGILAMGKMLTVLAALPTPPPNIEPIKPVITKIETLIENCGVDAETLEKVDPMDPRVMGNDEFIAELGSGISDPPGFLGKMFGYMEEAKELSGGNGPGALRFGEASLENLEIDGDQASADVANGDPGSPKKVNFVKTDGGWKVKFAVRDN